MIVHIHNLNCYTYCTEYVPTEIVFYVAMRNILQYMLYYTLLSVWALTDLVGLMLLPSR